MDVQGTPREVQEEEDVSIWASKLCELFVLLISLPMAPLSEGSGLTHAGSEHSGGCGGPGASLRPDINLVPRG